MFCRHARNTMLAMRHDLLCKACSYCVQVQQFAEVQQLMVTDVLRHELFQSPGRDCRNAKDCVPGAEHAALEVFASRHVTGAHNPVRCLYRRFGLCCQSTWMH